MKTALNKLHLQLFNEKIEADTWQCVEIYTDKSTVEISEHIKELDKEWEIERYLGVNMSTLALTGLALAYFVHINWLILPAIVLIFFLQHYSGLVSPFTNS